MTGSSWLLDVVHLVRLWWQTDRIRISPHERKLWTAQPGNLLMIDGEQAEIISRQTLQEPSGTLELLCRTATGQGILRVSSGSSSSGLSLCWQTENSCCELPVAEVQIWN